MTKACVQFVGYCAFIDAAKDDVWTQCATLDFVSGCVILNTREGYVCVPALDALGPFLSTLSKRAGKLQRLLDDLSASYDERIVRANYSATKCLETGSKVINLGNRSLHLNPGAELRRVLRQLQELFADVRQVLKEAKRVGSRMERRPYSEYICSVRACSWTDIWWTGRTLWHF